MRRIEEVSDRVHAGGMDILDRLGPGPFTYAIARESGVTRAQLRHLVDHGVLRRPLRGVYVASALRDSVDLRARAAALVVPPRGVVCDLSAAFLHGIDLLDFASLDLLPDVEVVSAAGEPTRRNGIFGGKRTLRPEDVMSIGGVRVTTPLRTACDVARLRGRLRAIAALDAFRREHQVTETQLTAMLPRFKGHRGVVQLRELVPLSTDEADSQPESWIRLMIHDASLPMPEPQVWTLLPEWGWVRTENAYAHLRIAVEYDGEEFHTSEDDRERDERRRKALRDAGWIVIVVRKDGFSPTARQRWMRELADAIALRSPTAPTKRVYSRGPDHPAYRRRRTVRR